MGKRKWPFGYKVENGCITPHSREAECVRKIFQLYLTGLSFNGIVSFLKDQNVFYDEGKLWNKNMVARILENTKYIGEDGYPPIITEVEYNSALERRMSNYVQTEKTEAQKILRKLCGEALTENIVLQVRNLLNGLIRNPNAVNSLPFNRKENSAVEKKQAELDEALDQQPINEDAAYNLIRSLASMKYETLDSMEYETERIRRLLQSAAPMEELDAQLLKACVARVVIAEIKVSLVLKNGQVVERIVTI